MNYPSEIEVAIQGQKAEEWRSGKKQRCAASENGGCLCTGRCLYTREQWRDLQKIKERVKFTGVNEMKFTIGD